MNIIQNMIYLIGSIGSTIGGLVDANTVYDKRFMEKFSNEDDKKTLDDTVNELKELNDNSPKTIQLKNKEEVTIVVL